MSFCRKLALYSNPMPLHINSLHPDVIASLNNFLSFFISFPSFFKFLGVNNKLMRITQLDACAAVSNFLFSRAATFKKAVLCTPSRLCSLSKSLKFAESDSAPYLF
jgi:hypothetical protein